MDEWERAGMDGTFPVEPITRTPIEATITTMSMMQKGDVANLSRPM